jgi:hypothetical protein
MSGAYIRATYKSIERPFELIGRGHGPVETNYWTIAYLSKDNAQLLAAEGLSWRDGEPDWEAHERRIELLLAGRDKANAEKRIAELRGQA